jgi:hypothetical protein
LALDERELDPNSTYYTPLTDDREIKTEPDGPTEKVLTMGRHVLTICWRWCGILNLVNNRFQKI